mmetsp:Transcript_15691/g.32106  ORF Transcript_15691/g.32106 Transcript_15691/m.32106 type:complete len:311 (-) Transcript_15691:259-1191(-)
MNNLIVCGIPIGVCIVVEAIASSITTALTAAAADDDTDILLFEHSSDFRGRPALVPHHVIDAAHGINHAHFSVSFLSFPPLLFVAQLSDDSTANPSSIVVPGFFAVDSPPDSTSKHNTATYIVLEIDLHSFRIGIGGDGQMHHSLDSRTMFRVIPLIRDDFALRAGSFVRDIAGDIVEIVFVSFSGHDDRGGRSGGRGRIGGRRRGRRRRRGSRRRGRIVFAREVGTSILSGSRRERHRRKWQRRGLVANSGFVRAAVAIVIASAHREQAWGTHDDDVGYMNGWRIKGQELCRDGRGDDAFLEARMGKSR